MIYIFCLYHFSVKCIIKKNDLSLYGPLKHLIELETYILHLKIFLIVRLTFY